MRCLLPALLLGVAKNHCLTTRELRVLFPQPSKNVADFLGFHKKESSCRCGITLIFLQLSEAVRTSIIQSYKWFSGKRSIYMHSVQEWMFKKRYNATLVSGLFGSFWWSDFGISWWRTWEKVDTPRFTLTKVIWLDLCLPEFADCLQFQTKILSTYWCSSPAEPSKDTDVIVKLKQDEIELTRKVG